MPACLRNEGCQTAASLGRLGDPYETKSTATPHLAQRRTIPCLMLWAVR